MASLTVTHQGDRIDFLFSVGVDEIDLSGFSSGQAVSAATEPAPAQQPAADTTSTPGNGGEQPAPTPGNGGEQPSPTPGNGGEQPAGG